MNVQARIAIEYEVEMSPDGEVLIPEAIRRAKGFVPGMKLVMGFNDLGQAVIMTRTQAKRVGETAEQREARIANALNALAGKFSTGQSTDEIMVELRGVGEE